jgi:CRP-like cAMP-binding protein
MLNSYKTSNNYSADSVKVNALSNPPVKTLIREAVSDKWKQFSRDTFSVEEFTNNRLLSALPADDFTRLLPHLQKITFSCGENIFHPNDDSCFIYFPETAVYSQLNVLEDGRTVETAMIGNEGLVGLTTVLSCLQNANPWTQTLIEGSAYRINVNTFKQEFNNGGFLHTSFLEYLNSYIKQITQRAICNNHHLIEERFSTWLLMLDDRCGKNKLILTHEQIAHFLGVHRPSVTCIARDLREKGIIEYCRGRIAIINRPMLENSACECYSTMSV